MDNASLPHKDKLLSEEIQNLGINLENEIASITDRSQTSNPQLLFKAFKDEIINRIRSHARKVIPKIDNTIRRLKDQIKETLNSPGHDSEQQYRSAGILEERIAKLENKRHNNKRVHIAAHNKLEGETISKYWSQVNKTRKPRDIIHCLEIPEVVPPQYVYRSDKMTELARDYHHNLLSDGLNTAPNVRALKITEVLSSITPETTLPDRHKATMSEKLTEQEVRTALKLTKNGTASGINGLPYELWKDLENKYMEFSLEQILLKAGCALYIRKKTKDK